MSIGDLASSVNWTAVISYAFLYLLAPSVALAQLTQVVPFEGTATGSLIEAVRSIVNGLLVLAGIIAVIFVIIGGVRYITSQGDDNAQAQAKLTIIYALIGVVIIALSTVLVNFIIRAAT